MSLHILAKAELLDTCLAVFDTETDQLLLIEDAVKLAAQRDALPANSCAREADLKARGLSSALETIDDSSFVALCVKHPKSVSWY